MSRLIFRSLSPPVRQSADGFLCNRFEYVAESQPPGSGQDQVCCQAAANDFVHKLFIKRNGPREHRRSRTSLGRGEACVRKVASLKI